MLNEFGTSPKPLCFKKSLALKDLQIFFLDGLKLHKIEDRNWYVILLLKTSFVIFNVDSYLAFY